MPALYFGQSQSALLGVFSEAASNVRRDHGVVLCPPIGQEHVRSHWAMRQLSVALNKAGFDCLRFDWFGVGDSAGELHEATLARWAEDLVAAKDELRDASGVRDVSLVGLRFGATLAALGAEEVDAANVVLWDPVVFGNRFVRSLRLLTDSLTTDSLRYFEASGRAERPPSELVGFDYGSSLLREIESVDLTERVPDAPLCLVRSFRSLELEALGRRLRDAKDATVRDVTLDSRWVSPDDVEELLLPGDALRAVTAYLEERTS